MACQLHTFYIVMQNTRHPNFLSSPQAVATSFCLTVAPQVNLNIDTTPSVRNKKMRKPEGVKAFTKFRSRWYIYLQSDTYVWLVFDTNKILFRNLLVVVWYLFIATFSILHIQIPMGQLRLGCKSLTNPNFKLNFNWKKILLDVQHITPFILKKRQKLRDILNLYPSPVRFCKDMDMDFTVPIRKVTLESVALGLSSFVFLCLVIICFDQWASTLRGCQGDFAMCLLPRYWFPWKGYGWTSYIMSGGVVAVLYSCLCFCSIRSQYAGAAAPNVIELK